MAARFLYLVGDFMTAVFLYCRAGFEAECAAEIQAQAAVRGAHGYCKAKAGSGYVLFQPGEPEAAEGLIQALSLGELVFARQWFVVLGLRTDLPPGDRVAPLVETAMALPGPVADTFLETPDTNEGKSLSALCRAIGRPLRSALHEAGLVADDAVLRLHICFLSTHAAYLGYAPLDNSTPWPGGVPRLKSPAAAPSRSTLKLEEALLHFLGAEGRDRALLPGMTAVDLGAAPGGWTWQLTRRGLRVIAVDNGPMDAALMESGLVEHLREDGFRYQPPQPVEWMVCDMVEQPVRVAELAARWLSRGWCRRTVFNLKLPMKKRYQEVQRCLDLVRSRLDEAGVRFEMGCKQLYHDREEVTVYVRTAER